MTIFEISAIIVGLVMGYWLISKLLTMLQRPPMPIGKKNESANYTKQSTDSGVEEKKYDCSNNTSEK